MRFAVLALAGAASAAAFAPSSVPALRGSKSLCMSAQAAPPAKLEHPKAKVEAEAVNAKQWGTQTLSKPAVNHPSTGTGAQAWLEGNHEENLKAMGYTIFRSTGSTTASANAAPSKPAAAAGTQAPPPAKLPLPKAKLEAAAVNAKQWPNDAAASGSPVWSPLDAVKTPWTGAQSELEADKAHMAKTAGKAATAEAPATPAVVIKESSAAPWSALDGIKVPWTGSAASGAATQAPPPAKLELPKAKLEAMAVNEKQWLNASPAAEPLAPAVSAEPDPAALERAASAQQALSDTTSTFAAKLKALQNSATSKLGADATAPVAVGPNDLSKFREEAMGKLKKAISV